MKIKSPLALASRQLGEARGGYKKDVILNLFQNLLPLIKEGDTGSGSGMTELSLFSLTHIFFEQSRNRGNFNTPLTTPLDAPSSVPSQAILGPESSGRGISKLNIQNPTAKHLMIIENVEAYWLRCPIQEVKQHRSDYGLLTHFDMTLVVVTTKDGRQGFGEAKAAVGSSGVCASIVSCVENELKSTLIGQDTRNITRIWEQLYSGTRDHYALARGRKFPILGRRGLTISAISGVDMALWDLKGKELNVPVVELLGGACRDQLPAYASGGWADVDGIGEQLSGYVSKGFDGVKMRVGVMDDTVAKSVARVKAAREALGPEVKIMADAHGTYSVPEAKQFCRGVEDSNLYWFEEPISPDNPKGTAEVRASTSIPIAAGESEYTCFDVRDLISHWAIDVVQPDAAIIGGISEAMRVGHLAQAWQLELAPHCWGSAFSFMAGVTVAFASPSATIIEFSLGGNPMMYELVNEKIEVENGRIKAPDTPGLGVTPNWDFVKDYKQKV